MDLKHKTKKILSTVFNSNTQPINGICEVFWQKICISEININKKCSPMPLLTFVLWIKWVLVRRSWIDWIFSTQATAVFGVSVLRVNSHQHPATASSIPGGCIIPVILKTLISSLCLHWISYFFSRKLLHCGLISLSWHLVCQEAN